MTESLVRRVVLGIEYDGSLFHGWQIQHHADTIQAHVQQALAQIAAHPVVLHCAGRTDAGVHAIEQIAHFETAAERPERAWVLGTNTHLPRTIRIRWARYIDHHFHARFSALARHYRYLILCTHTSSALWYQRALWVHQPLDVQAMQAAAACLIGTHDFSSFRAQGCQAKSPIRTIDHLTLQQWHEWLELRISANGFLHHMVRNIVGVLLAVGRGQAATTWPLQLLEQRDRRLAGITASPYGLYLAHVSYPAHFALPDHSLDGSEWPFLHSFDTN
jgi:tRNA pseudouridine38-40 synthase